MIKTIKEESSAEIVIKKSKFIANVFYVESEKQAQDILKEMTKKYNDAKHNCYAYVINELQEDGINKIQKSSDNGEPSGTAGAPLLDVIKKNGLTNVLIIVTRYFGGILLGTGGLVKAYTQSAVEAIRKNEIIEKEIGNIYNVEISYSDLKEFTHYCDMENITISDTEYNESINIIIETTAEKYDKLMNNKTNILNTKLLSNNNWIIIK
ncbi:MAG: YigZ family protein [Clostridia bacterium]|nr:YigZ family protein [Clostridia bacterium]